MHSGSDGLVEKSGEVRFNLDVFQIDFSGANLRSNANVIAISIYYVPRN
jgi:hypothetical protein